MQLSNLYSQSGSQTFVNRINQLTPNTAAQWGKMNVAQMMAHCNVSFEMGHNENYKKSNGFLRFILKNLVKGGLVNEKPLKMNSSTAPEMEIKTEKDFVHEKQMLIRYLNKTVEVGENYFNGKDHPGFGVMTSGEWNVFLGKHLDHHLTQFGV